MNHIAEDAIIYLAVIIGSSTEEIGDEDWVVKEMEIRASSFSYDYTAVEQGLIFAAAQEMLIDGRVADTVLLQTAEAIVGGKVFKTPTSTPETVPNAPLTNVAADVIFGFATFLFEGPTHLIDESLAEREVERFRSRFQDIYTRQEKEELSQAARQLLPRWGREPHIANLLEVIALGRFSDLPVRLTHAEHAEEERRIAQLWSIYPGIKPRD